MSELINGSAQTIPAIYQWGIDVIKSVQTISNPVLTECVKVFSDGSVYGFAILIPLIYIWNINYKKGLHLFYLLTFATSLNSSLKVILHAPRPYTFAPEIMLKTESSFSTPSGHSFTSALMYPATLFYKSETKLSFKIKLSITIILIFLIGLSRIYLGVHYPTDVLLGWILGGAVSIIFIFVTEKFEKCIEDFTTSPSQIYKQNCKSIKFAVAAIFAFLELIIYTERTILAGALLGFAFGNIYIYEQLKINFNAKSGTIIQKILRSVLGILISIMPILIFKFAKIDETHPQFRLYSFLEFFISAAIISGLMPMLFIKLKLGEQNANR